MSSLKVASINHPSAPSGGLAISTAGNVTGAGMDLIVSQSFSAASAVNVNGCFSTTYDNYAVQLLLSSIPAQNLSLRFRAAASDNSTANYFTATQRHDGSSWSLSRDGSGQTAILLIANGVVGYSETTLNMTITAPAIAYRTGLISVVADSYTYSCNAAFAAATTFDGLSVYPASSTISGTLRVYGLRN